jgi:Putative peptidoglycan binding domain
VPKKAVADETPRRRRGAAAAAIEAGEERGFAMRILLHSPKDTIAGLLAFAAASGIIANALFLQSGPHPAPMFGSVVHIPPASPVTTSLLPRPRPASADFAASEPRLLLEPRANEVRGGEPRAADPLGNLVKATTTGSLPAANVAPPPSSNVLRPPAPIPMVHVTGSRRVAAVQRTLTEYGYGQLKPTGTIGADTQAAIAKFERDRKLPVTGQVSDRLVRELAAMIGHPVD